MYPNFKQERVKQELPQPPPLLQQPLPNYNQQPMYPPFPQQQQPPHYPPPPTRPAQYQQQQQYSQVGAAPPPQTSQGGGYGQYHHPVSAYPPPGAHQYQYPQIQQPQAQQYHQQHPPSTVHSGFNHLWGQDHVDLLKQRHVLPPGGVKPPEIRHTNDFWRDKNAAPDIFRCTLTKIPETKSLLQKSRLPLGILIHPFKDLTQLPVVQCSTIVRCRACRTYINPFVYFIDNRRWKCNLCFRANDLPDEFQYDPLTKTYGDPNRRPEILSGTIEFLAPADYMVRPPQAAVYVFVLEATAQALDSGYLKIFCDTLLENLGSLPGDSRTQVAFITYNSRIQFYNISEGVEQLNVGDVEEWFIPRPEGLLVKLNEEMEHVETLLRSLPTMFGELSDNGNCLGAAVAAANKLTSQVGGRITIFQHTLPNLGPGILPHRESKNLGHLSKELNPSTDYYKKIALDCSSQYIAVDLFVTGDGYTDLASVSCISKYSGGCVYKIVNLGDPNKQLLLESMLNRYLSRKIGFEAVMRVRCTRGLSIHTFHGNLFVRSTDLLSLPNCNPDSGFGMQVTIDEDLRDFQNVAFQAALLYTSSKGERRIRVHTLCLPVASNINDVILSVDQQCVVGLLAKMGVDRCLTSSLTDAREAFLNAVVDILSAYGTTQNSDGLALIAPPVLQMLPAYIHALLRGMGFLTNLKPTLDCRTHFFNQLKTLPLYQLIQMIYPDLYRIDGVYETPLLEHEQTEDEEPNEIPNFGLLSLCSDRIDANGVYLMDSPDSILIYVSRNVSKEFCGDVLNAPQGFNYLNEMNELPELDNPASLRIRNFVQYLQTMKPYFVGVRVLREDSRERVVFSQKLVEDRGDMNANQISYYEFLQQVKSIVKY